jgi:hypothetical protein
MVTHQWTRVRAAEKMLSQLVNDAFDTAAVCTFKCLFWLFLIRLCSTGLPSRKGPFSLLWAGRRRFMGFGLLASHATSSAVDVLHRRIRWQVLDDVCKKCARYSIHVQHNRAKTAARCLWSCVLTVVGRVHHHEFVFVRLCPPCVNQQRSRV